MQSYTRVAIAIIRHLQDPMIAARKEKAAVPRACFQGDLCVELVIPFSPEAQVGVLPGDLVEKGNSKRAEGCAPKAEAEMAC